MNNTLKISLFSSLCFVTLAGFDSYDPRQLSAMADEAENILNVRIISAQPNNLDTESSQYLCGYVMEVEILDVYKGSKNIETIISSSALPAGGEYTVFSHSKPSGSLEYMNSSKLHWNDYCKNEIDGNFVNTLRGEVMKASYVVGTVKVISRG